MTFHGMVRGRLPNRVALQALERRLVQAPRLLFGIVTFARLVRAFVHAAAARPGTLAGETAAAVGSPEASKGTTGKHGHRKQHDAETAKSLNKHVPLPDAKAAVIIVVGPGKEKSP